MDVPAEKQTLLEEIEARADASYAKVVGRSVSSPLTVYGLRVWEIREIVKRWRRQHKDISFEDLLPLVDTLWAGQSREERLVGLELLQHYPHLIPELPWVWFDKRLKDLDNWELTDVLGVGVLGPWVACRTEQGTRHLHGLLSREDVWSRRLGLVATVGLNRSQPGAETLSLVLSLIDQVKGERHPAITQAVSWVLRQMSGNDPAAVVAYLDENEALLAGHVLREVRNKLQTGRKDGKRNR
jgi:3-methyladenine DNA glycosylase AlkD